MNMRIIKKYNRNLILKECHALMKMRRLIDQENKQSLPHQEITKVINLGSNEERKNVKIGITLSVERKS